MSLPSTAKPLIVYKNETTRGKLFIQKETREKKTKNMIGFLGSLNPFTWFSEFSNIEVTLEEFATAKNKKLL